MDSTGRITGNADTVVIDSYAICRHDLLPSLTSHGKDIIGSTARNVLDMEELL